MGEYDDGCSGSLCVKRIDPRQQMAISVLDQRPGSANGQPQLPCDLGDGPFPESVQLERSARPLRQLGQGALGLGETLAGMDRRFHAGTRISHLSDLLIAEATSLDQALAALVIDTEVARHPIQIGTRIEIVRKPGRGRGQHTNKGVLGDVGGGLWVMATATQKAIDFRRMPLEQVLDIPSQRKRLFA